MKKLIKRIITKLFPFAIVKFKEISETRYEVENIKHEINNNKNEINNIIIQKSDEIFKKIEDIKAENIEIKNEMTHNKNEITQIKNVLSTLTDKDFNFYKLRKKLELIEYYQPAYMVGGLDINPKRNCKDRCRAIEKTLNNDFAGLKILDIGASLGYVCYYFADRGAVTEGWEINADNAEAARLIGHINGISSRILNKTFGKEEVESLRERDYDIIIILSVLHHVIHFNGLDYVKELIKIILDKISILIVELALKNEDKTLFWNDALPEDELEIFDYVKDEIEIINLGYFDTHLSSLKRPLYKIIKKNHIAINNKEYFYDKKTCMAYKNSILPYINSNLGRYYYISKDFIIKEYIIKDKILDNKIQIIADLFNMLFLNNLKNIKSTHLIDFEVNSNRAIIAFSRNNGELLSDIIEEKEINPVIVAKDVLEFLEVLEEYNIHHNDIRTWNILWDNEHAQVIDYGLMSPVVIDDDYTALLWVIYAIIEKRKEDLIQGNKFLPPMDIFQDNSLIKLYTAIENGEKSANKLLEYINDN